MLVIDPFDYFRVRKECQMIVDGEMLYSDSNHLSNRGARHLAEGIAARLVWLRTAANKS